MALYFDFTIFPPVYSNDQHHQQSTTQQLEAYQRLQVSDQPTQDQPVNHQRIPSESSILDEPIDVPTIEETNNDEDFSANFDDRTYANYPSNHDRYADQSLSMSMENEEPPLASSTIVASRVQDNRYSTYNISEGSAYPKPRFWVSDLSLQYRITNVRYINYFSSLV